MRTIPVLMNFDQQQPIGTMTIDETRLPPGMGYVFSLGARALDTEIVNGAVRVTRAELLCVSLQTDEQYLACLEREQR